jgi:AcrR family transcriptional regulator
MDAAISGLIDVGADHLSLRDVARRAGVSHAAPAHHFGDKAGLLTTVATEGFDLFAARLTAAATPIGDNPSAALASLGRAYADFAERYPGHFEVMFRPGLIHADDPTFTAAGDAAFALLRSYIADCQRAGWRPEADPDDLAVAAWSLAHGVSVLRLQGSLARHFRDDSLDGVIAIAASILDSTE